MIHSAFLMGITRDCALMMLSPYVYAEYLFWNTYRLWLGNYLRPCYCAFRNSPLFLPYVAGTLGVARVTIPHYGGGVCTFVSVRVT